MQRILGNLWRDDAGALLATEWVFIATILVIGLIVGLRAVQQSVLNELEEVAGAIGSLSQSFSFGGVSGCCDFTNSSAFTDQSDSWPISTCSESGDAGRVICPD
jgi:Flp pilus assembly pilin Flp